MKDKITLWYLRLQHYRPFLTALVFMVFLASGKLCDSWGGSYDPKQ